MGNIFLAYYYREEDDLGDIEGHDVLWDNLSSFEQPIHNYRRWKSDLYNGQIICRKDYGFDILN